MKDTHKVDEYVLYQAAGFLDGISYELDSFRGEIAKNYSREIKKVADKYLNIKHTLTEDSNAKP